MNNACEHFFWCNYFSLLEKSIFGCFICIFQDRELFTYAKGLIHLDIFSHHEDNNWCHIRLTYRIKDYTGEDLSYLLSINLTCQRNYIQFKSVLEMILTSLWRWLQLEDERMAIQLLTIHPKQSYNAWRRVCDSIGRCLTLMTRMRQEKSFKDLAI